MGPLANGIILLQGKFDKAILCLSYDFSSCHSFLAETGNNFPNTFRKDLVSSRVNIFLGLFFPQLL